MGERGLFGDFALGIVEIAEDNGAGGASCLTGGNDLAVFNLTLLDSGADIGRFYPLHAIGAFLHDAPRANGDLGISDIIPLVDVRMGVIQEVESTDLIGTVI